MKAFTFSLVYFLAGLTSALYVPVSIERRDSLSAFNIPSQVGFNFISSPASNQPAIQNDHDLLYQTQIVLGGQTITVQIDTGSSDLWVFSREPINNLNLSKAQPVKEAYGSGSASGPVAFAPFSIGSYSVESQAFINATDVKFTFTVFPESLFPAGVFGIFGLGFNTLDGISPLAAAVSEAYPDNPTLGQSPINNIFKQNSSLPNYISVLLGRSNDLDGVAQGVFTISETIPGYENITQTPKLERFDTGAGSRWSVLLDAISINGNNVTLNTTGKNVPPGKSVAVLDTGATDGSMPKFIVDAIYSQMPGAVFNASSKEWIIPCNSTADVRFVFGGQEIPIHPLDLARPQVISTSSGPRTTCVANFVEFDLGAGFQGFDMLLGDAFLRNVYAMFDYGKLSSDAKSVSDAFIQLLPRTDPQLALKDFESSRSAVLLNSPKEASADQIRANIPPPTTTTTTSSSFPSPPASNTASNSPSSTPSHSGSARRFTVGGGGGWLAVTLVCSIVYFLAYP